MALAKTNTQILRSDGGSATVAVNAPLTGNGSQELPLGLDENYHGADGESLTFDITDITDGHRVTISGAQGSSSFDVMNGAQGDQGVQGETGPQGPEGPQGPSGQQGPAGQNGVNGISPTFRFDRNDDYVVVTMSGAQGEDSFTIYDGTSATEYSAGANIDITDYVISGKDWTDEIISATSGKLDTSSFESYTATHSSDDTAAYSAGDNIDITDHVISGKDWSDEINNASTAGSAAATAWVSDQHYLTEHQSLSALMSADLLGITGGVITGYSGMPVSAGMTYSGITPIVVNNEEEKISADCIELSAGSGIDSNKLALGIIEVSAAIPTGVGGLTLYSYPATTADIKTIVDDCDTDPQNIAISANISGGNHVFYFDHQTTAMIGDKDYIFTENVNDNSTRWIQVRYNMMGYQHYTVASGTTDSHIKSIAYSDLTGAMISDVYFKPLQYQIEYVYATEETQYGTETSSFNLQYSNRLDGDGTKTFTGFDQHGQLAWVSLNGGNNTKTSGVSSVGSVPTYYASTANIQFSAVANTLAASGIVFPYDAWANSRQVYNFYGSAAASNLSSFTFKKYQSNGYEKTLLVYDDNGTTGVSAESLKVWATPQEAECKVVIVSTSGDIPASGSTDGKVYVVTGT